MTKTSELISSMSVHGCPRIASSKSLTAKLLWSLIFISASAGFLYCTVSRAGEFLQYRVYISVKKKIEQPMTFPAVTICNTNLFFLYLKNHTVHLPSTFENKTCHNKDNDLQFEHACKLFLSGVNGSITFDHVKQPEFPNNFINPNTYIPCFTFNKKSIFKQKSSVGGLRMLLYVNMSEITYYSKPLEFSHDERFGLMFIVHNQDVDITFPFYDFLLDSGTKTDITLRKVEYNRKKAPYPSQCIDHDPKVERIFGIYSLENCYNACYFDQVWAECKDVPPMARYLTQWHSFENSTKESRTCAENFFSNNFNQSLCVCRPPCKETVYLKTVQSVKWPADHHIKSMRSAFAESPFNETFQNFSNEAIKQSFVYLNIRFADGVKEVISEEELYSLMGLLSELGGLMGLFLGASLISAMELFWVLGSSVTSFHAKIRVADREMRKQDINRLAVLNFQQIDNNKKQ